MPLLKIRGTHEPLYVETRNICSVEAIEGGRACLVRTADGERFRAPMTVDAILAAAMPEPDPLDTAPGWLGKEPTRARETQRTTDRRR